ncbi:MAG: hypothetical protein BWK74_07790 [Desulfobacteraceae bacterium A6]|nr:MAG: hypothetical protein BWK74_07790 [Desulfobacteraceae bacterium A6]
MKRTTIICIAVLFLTAAGSLIIYRNYLQVEGVIKADFNSQQLTMATLISHGAELAVDDVKHMMAISSWITSIIKGNEKCLASMKAVYNDDLKEKIQTSSSA